MIKIVIDPSGRGFDVISPEAAKKFIELGVPVFENEEEEKRSKLDWIKDKYAVKNSEFYKDGYYLSCYFNYHRDDKDLVKIVEALGEKASALNPEKTNIIHDFDGRDSYPVIVEIPDEIEWHVVTPDWSGEYVVERHREWFWSEEGTVMQMSKTIPEKIDEDKDKKSEK